MMDKCTNFSDEKSYSICLFSCCMQQANIKPFHNCSSLLNKISKTLYLIPIYQGETQEVNYSVNNIYEIVNEYHDSQVLTIFEYFKTQMKVLYYFFSIRRDVDVCAFYLGDISIFPIIFSKVFRKRTVLLLGGCLEKEILLKNDSFGRLKLLLQRINLSLIDKLVLYSPRLIEEWNLKRYKEKVSIAHEHSLDFSEFKLTKEFQKRENLIGYIGRFSEEKGIINFIRACSLVSEKNKEYKFLVGGSGHLENEIKKLIFQYNLTEEVNLVGWVSHETLPIYLNNLKLIVLPSFSEGLPNIMLEAMACGTPVLVTPVGSIPDYVVDTQTGFIMEDNSPECIAKNILRALSFNDINKITDHAELMVESKFKPEVTVQMYKEAFSFQNMDIKKQ